MKDKMHTGFPAGHLPGQHQKGSFSAQEQMVLFILILLAELWIFSGTFHKFFTHDSLYWMTNIVHSWRDFVPFLSAPSQEMSYRPVNLAFVSLLAPFLGTEPQPWHWVPLLFHLANTLLFWLVAKRILPSTPAALASAAFWGLHAVGGWITYDITYLSDFLPAFLLLVLLLISLEAHRRDSFLLKAASGILFTLALMAKEAAVTFPLAVWLCLALAEVRASGNPVTRKAFLSALRRCLPSLVVFILIDAAFVALYGYWLYTGRIYAQGSHSAYDIGLLSNLGGKAKYMYWALNLPDELHIPDGARNRILALGFMSLLLAFWAADILRRRFRLSCYEWSGVIWFIGLNIPALLLSQRLAYWYLYMPLFGLALTFGVFAGNLQSFAAARWHPKAGLIALPLMLGPVLFSTHVQTRSYVAESDSSYQSDLLGACISDFRRAHPTLPAAVHLYFLPAFEEGVSRLLSSDPIGRGELFRLYYPGSKITAGFAHRGDRLPENLAARTDVVVLQYLMGHLYDVTRQFRTSRRMTMYVLPTREREIPPLLKKIPEGGKELYRELVEIAMADAGAELPADHATRSDLWMLQYIDGQFDEVTSYYVNENTDRLCILPTMDGNLPRLRQLEENPEVAARLSRSRVYLLSADNLPDLAKDYAARSNFSFVEYLGGRFSDVTAFYKGRYGSSGLRLAKDLGTVRYSVDRTEFYPDYDRFDTPTGAPVFFPTPGKEILTQIGGSMITIPLPKIPANSVLCFDVSWMHEEGDGAWAEARIRAGGADTTVYCKYLKGGAKQAGLIWKEIRFDLKHFQNADGELILRCYNKPGGNTVADWLNWRDIAIETSAP